MSIRAAVTIKQVSWRAHHVVGRARAALDVVDCPMEAGTGPAHAVIRGAVLQGAAAAPLGVAVNDKADFL
jgi:hypothetical protein